MPTWKPVKPLNGPASQGRQHAYQLDKIDAPFLKRRNGDGSISYKKNGALFTKAAEPEELIDDDGSNRVSKQEIIKFMRENCE